MNAFNPRFTRSLWRAAATPLLCAAVLLGTSACSNMGYASAGADTLSAERIAQIVASSDRSAADRTNDMRRKPELVLAFIGVRPGSTALDLSAGGGYTTELLARAVGSTGRVYGQIPPSRRSSAQTLAERAKNPALAHLQAAVRPFDDPVPPEVAGQIDLVTLMYNYHDLGHMGVDRARMNAAVFAAMKSGGVYVIADHSGRPGTGISESGTLHRIEEVFLQKEVEAAGFKFVAQGNFLRNPADPRDKNTPEPPQPKDEFFLKFVKP